MTTRVAIAVPAPGHNDVRVILQDLVPSGIDGVSSWVDALSHVVPVGHLLDHLHVYDNRRIIIEELPPEPATLNDA